MNFANNKIFGYFSFEAGFCYFDSSAKIVIKVLKSHLPYSSNSRFENSIKKALGLNGFIWSSSFSYIWKCKGSYDL